MWFEPIENNQLSYKYKLKKLQTFPLKNDDNNNNKVQNWHARFDSHKKFISLDTLPASVSSLIDGRTHESIYK